MMERPEEAMSRIADETAQAADLVRDKRIHRIEDDSTDAAHAPHGRIFMSFARELREERPEKAFRLARTSACRYEQIPAAHGCLERLNLMTERRRIDAEMRFRKCGKKRLEPCGEIGFLDTVRLGNIGWRRFDVGSAVEDALVIEAVFKRFDEHGRLRKILGCNVSFEFVAQFALHIVCSIGHANSSPFCFSSVSSSIKENPSAVRSTRIPSKNGAESTRSVAMRKPVLPGSGQLTYARKRCSSRGYW